MDRRPVIELSSLCRHRSCQLVEQRLGRLQDRSVETFGEPTVDRRKQVTRFRLPALVAPEPGETDGGPQLVELRALPLGNGDSLTIALFSPGPISGGIQQVARHLIQHLSFIYPLVGGLDYLRRLG